MKHQFERLLWLSVIFLLVIESIEMPHIAGHLLMATTSYYDIKVKDIGN